MVTKVAEDQQVSLDDAMDIPGAPGTPAPAPEDHRAWTAWLSATALPQVQPMRMPQQRFEYWRLERPRPAAISGEAAPEGALG